MNMRSSSALVLVVLSAACLLQPGYAFWVDYSPTAVQNKLTSLAATPPVTNFLITPNTVTSLTATIAATGNSVTAAQRNGWKRIGELVGNINRRGCLRLQTHPPDVGLWLAVRHASRRLGTCWYHMCICATSLHPHPYPPHKSTHLTVHNLHTPLPLHTHPPKPTGAKIWFFLSNYDLDYLNAQSQPTPPFLAGVAPVTGPTVTCGRNARQLVSVHLPGNLIDPPPVLHPCAAQCLSTSSKQASRA